MRSRLEYSDVDDIISVGLHEYLDALQLKINHISDLIDSNYFRLKDNFIS